MRLMQFADRIGEIAPAAQEQDFGLALPFDPCIQAFTQLAPIEQATADFGHHRPVHERRSEHNVATANAQAASLKAGLKCSEKTI